MSVERIIAEIAKRMADTLGRKVENPRCDRMNTQQQQQQEEEEVPTLNSVRVENDPNSPMPPKLLGVIRDTFITCKTHSGDLPE